MWLLVEYPGGGQALFEHMFSRVTDIAHLKSGYRAHGLRVVAVYRRKVREPVSYDSEGIEA